MQYKRNQLFQVLFYLVLCLSVCSCSMIPKRGPSTITATGIIAKQEQVNKIFQESDWLFKILIGVAAAGIAVALGWKVKEGWAIAGGAIAGCGLIITFTRYAALIATGILVTGLIYMTTRIKFFRDLGNFAVAYAENLKKKLATIDIETVNTETHQPKAVQKEIAKMKAD